MLSGHKLRQDRETVVCRGAPKQRADLPSLAAPRQSRPAAGRRFSTCAGQPSFLPPGQSFRPSMTALTVGAVPSRCISQSTVARSSMPRGDSKPSTVVAAHSRAGKYAFPSPEFKYTCTRSCIASLNQMRFRGSLCIRQALVAPQMGSIKAVQQLRQIS